ncbi:amidohydrolase family protein [Mesorhizobium sp.]|jgi:N-acetylglucosamine-6-phosphate deacetylase|uniref:N-acetylglucosamine-6-phosphate deacetylase n=1 Tax=Mesorhizobium sp. TaxID=1871066 RepID=UPI000FE595DA|nr:amidohydrolase family protein [Mesorhizobium sp.]RWO54459.1 MAG: N-acetylglucosamine-6-phosphate deacetylase [Mesorhizobium sp.]
MTRSGATVGNVYIDGQWTSARVTWRDGLVSTIEPFGKPSGGLFLIPGFVDLHCHGGGGADAMEAGEAAHQIARTHAAHGTAGFLVTTMTAPLPEVEDALLAVAQTMEQQGDDEAEILGVHLEGPFISPDQLGAQPPYAIPATIELMERLCALAPIRVVTLAPEADADGEVAAWLRTKGVRVQIGHTSVNFETAADWIRHRVDGVTHMFNAMGGFHHRKSGCIGAALAFADHAELISDLHHADTGALLAALRAIPGLYAVTDGTAASGMPDGEYRLGQHAVFRKNDTVRLASGGLAGSCLTMDQAFHNLISVGIPLEEAAKRTSTIAADYLGANKYGRLSVGSPASFVGVDERGLTSEVTSRGIILRA